MTEFFKYTCPKDYNRHSYEVVTKNNQKIKFDNWEDLQRYWYTFSTNLETVLIKDKNK